MLVAAIAVVGLMFLWWGFWGFGFTPLHYTMEILDLSPDSFKPPHSNDFSHHTSSTSHSPPLLPSPSIFPSTQQE
ncbi:hypothetical protein HBI18_099430 [Parastagonospora nodorum]|nr:hypothetical protein HBI18_099430 [Parastagonospora nodorum]